VSVTHVNRKGDTYYLLQSVTKTGKPKYYVSKKPGANTVDQVPEGYEVYEHPADGMVYVRKIRPTGILPGERSTAIAIIREITKRDVFFAEREGDSLVIYWPERDPVALGAMMSKIFGIPLDAGRSSTETSGGLIDKGVLLLLRTSPVLRFTLEDEAKRTFAAERMCHRGAKEFWLPISKTASLQELVRLFAPHLGQESMYELL